MVDLKCIMGVDGFSTISNTVEFDCSMTMVEEDDWYSYSRKKKKL